MNALKIHDILQTPEMRALPPKCRVAVVGLLNLFATHGTSTGLTETQVRTAVGVELRATEWANLRMALCAIGAVTVTEGLVRLDVSFFTRGLKKRVRSNRQPSKLQRLRTLLQCRAAAICTKVTEVAQAVITQPEAPLRLANEEYRLITDEQRQAILQWPQCYTNDEIDEGIRVLSQRRTRPKNPVGLLRKCILPEVRAGKRARPVQTSMTLLAQSPPAPKPSPPISADIRRNRALGLPDNFKPADRPVELVLAGLRNSNRQIALAT